MKKLIAVTFVVAAIAVYAFAPVKSDILEIGAKAPLSDMKMKDISEKEYALNDLKKSNGLLVIFSSNTCPFVVGNLAKNSDGWEGRYNEVHIAANKVGVGMTLVNSNEAFRGDVDSKPAMTEHAREQKYSMPYLIDENHELADAFGALTTPHVYLFDKNMELVYKGAIDDNVNSAAGVEKAYLKDALKNLAAGNKIEPNSTRQLGCSIKRVRK